MTFVIISRYILAIIAIIYIITLGFELYKKDIRGYAKVNLACPILFMIVGESALFASRRDWSIVTLGLIVVVIMIVTDIVIRKLYHDSCEFIYRVIIFLIAVSLVQMGALSASLYRKQAVFAVMGMLIMTLLPLFIKLLKGKNYVDIVCMIIGTLLLLYMVIRGDSAYGARIYLSFFGISFQPFELVKIAFVVFNSHVLTKKDKKWLIISAVEYVILSILLVLANDFGSILILSAVYVLMIYMVYHKRLIIIGSLATIVMAAFVLYSKVAHFRTRVTALVDPIGHIDDEGYQLSQSIFSIANGGLFGTGLTRGLPRAIPLVEMDFMFSAVCEELGLIVAFALIAASLALFCHLMNLCMSASVGDNSSRLSIGAIACLVIFQNFLTIGGALRFIPSTGVVLPFVSYGGSSFMGCSMLFAAVFAIIRYGRRGIYVAKR